MMTVKEKWEQVLPITYWRKGVNPLLRELEKKDTEEFIKRCRYAHILEDN